MTKLPDDNFTESEYISDAARTEAEVKVALELMHEVIAEIGSKGPTTLTISGGAITTPLSSLVFARSEGHATGQDDTLTSMATTGITEGRLVILRNSDPTSSEAAASEKITITNGTSADSLELTEGSGSFILCARRVICFAFSGTHWVEQWRSYGRKNAEDEAAERTSLGLGTAAVETVATTLGTTGDGILKVGSTDLTENQVLKVDGSGEIVAATSVELGGGDAATLDGNLPAAFVRTNEGSAQDIDANLTLTTAGATRLVTDTTGAAQTSGFSMEDGGVERGALFLDTSNAEVELRTATAGGTPTDSIKLDPGGGLLYNVAPSPGGGVWQTILSGAPVADHGLPGLDADKLDGSHLSDILSLLVTATVIGTRSGTVTQDNIGKIKLESTGGDGVLVQWGWAEGITSAGAAGSSVSYTYPEAYLSTPFVFYGGPGGFSSASGFSMPENSQNHFSTSTDFIHRARGQSGGFSYSSSSHPWIAIGAPA